MHKSAIADLCCSHLRMTSFVVLASLCFVGAFVYMLRCADGSYYVGSTVMELDRRVEEHNAGAFPGYTSRRRPVTLVWSESFDRLEDAAAAERKVKGWSRAKKRALIQGDWETIRMLAKRPTARQSSS
jgi:putative endonuclease